MLSKEDLAPHFRAVNVAGKRKGFRLEGIFWTVLKELAFKKNVSVSDYVTSCIDDKPEDAGASSQLRSAILGDVWTLYQEKNDALREFEIQNLISANPTPAFVISQDKKIVYHNAAFMRLLLRKFGNKKQESWLAGLNFRLEETLADLVEKIERANGKFVKSGFSMGIETMQFRGDVHAVLAPEFSKNGLIISFIADTW